MRFLHEVGHCYYDFHNMLKVKNIIFAAFDQNRHEAMPALLKKGVLNQHTFYVQKTTHLKVCYSSTPLGVLFACPENNTPLGVF